MASISRGPNGRRTVQFVAADGKRKSIRLGKASQRVAEEVKVKVEQLAAAVASGFPLDGETSQWLVRIGDDLADKLAAVGLIPRRGAARLEEFIDGYVSRRTDLKEWTTTSLRVAAKRITEFFAAAARWPPSRPRTPTSSSSG